MNPNNDMLKAVAEAACPQDIDHFRYMLKDMGPDERGTFETHCAACKECRTRLEGTRRGIDAFFEEDEREERSLSRPDSTDRDTGPGAEVRPEAEGR